MGAEYRALSHCRQGYEMTRVTPAAETEKYRWMLRYGQATFCLKSGFLQMFVFVV